MQRPSRCSVDYFLHRVFLLRRRASWGKALQFVIAITLTVVLVYFAAVHVALPIMAHQASSGGLDFEAPVKPPLLATASTVQVGAESIPSLSFKILQIPDMHYTGHPDFPCRNPPQNLVGPCTEANMTSFIASLLDDERPDFVVFSGDQIESVEVHHTVFQVNKALYDFSKEVIQRSIPWSMVFGNHDEGDPMSKRDMFRRINAMPFSYSDYGAFGTRVGNYALHVEAPSDGPWGPHGKVLFRLYFLDSEHGQFTPEQRHFASTVAARHAHQHAPAIMFFHNPIPEYAAYNAAASSTHGRQGEPVSHAHANSGMFDTIVQMGDVKAAFVGHDHLNDYCFKKDALHLCFGGGVGYGAAYGHMDIPRRARVIEWKWTPARETITTYLHAHGRTRSNDYVIYSESVASSRSNLRIH
ncbi:Aste57867_16540 [Aphanomyces stellatus]|uniref:Aste57867_16540 protein n=1 Tax=Aphanomyces stellatus TaxID=120398 RepID=A0A485L6I1_9STRA|nr:hypothetical protein As57867_016483 [Aphanomyces stellatus]VFT93314.1 Aste57867_16540 [Aphanomyces stellatus]